MRLFFSLILLILYSKLATANIYSAINVGKGVGKPKLDGAIINLQNSSPIMSELALGLCITAELRAELTAKIYQSTAKSINELLKYTQSGAGSGINLYYNLITREGISPFITGGISINRNKFKFSGKDINQVSNGKNKWTAGYQFGLGAEFDISMMKIDIAYKLYNFSLPKSSANYAHINIPLKAKSSLNGIFTLGARVNL